MIVYLISKSSILSLWFTSKNKIYESYITNTLLRVIYIGSNRLLPLFPKVFHKSIIGNKLNLISWKTILLFLFIASLALVPGYDTQTDIFLKTTFAESTANKQAFYLGIILSILILLPLFFIIVSEYKKLRVKIVFLRLELLLLIFFIITEISTISSYDVENSVNWIFKILRSLLIYYIFSRIILERKLYSYIFYAFIFIIILEGIIGFLQFLSGGLIGIPIENLDKIAETKKIVLNIDGTSYFRTAGTFNHPNALSGFIAVLLPLTIIMSLKPNPLIKFLALTTTVIGLATIILSLSRWSLITALFALCFTSLLINKYSGFKFSKVLGNLKKYIIIILTIIFIIFLNPIFINRFFEFSTSDLSLRVRTNLITESFFVIGNNPLLGIGGNNFVNFLVNYDATEYSVSNVFPAVVHNTYFLIASEIGIIGLLIFSFILVDITLKFFEKISYMSISQKLYSIGLYASIITFLFNGLWERKPINDHGAIFFWFALGFLVNLLYFSKAK